MNWQDYFEKGYIKGRYKNIEELNIFDNFEFQHADTVNDHEIPFIAIQILKEIGTELLETVVRNLYDNVTLGRVSMWYGVDNKAKNWHNDLYDREVMGGDEPHYDACILLYLDNNNEDVGNSIQFRNKIDEFIEYPDKGDFVVINQSLQFEHKATHIPNTARRLLCFDYNIEK
jgi:hypothetical protein